MNQLADRFIEPGLWLLGEWSLRWGLLIVLLLVWFRVRPPRQAAARYGLICTLLIVGFAVPFLPLWGAGFVQRPTAAFERTERWMPVGRVVSAPITASASGSAKNQAAALPREVEPVVTNHDQSASPTWIFPKPSVSLAEPVRPLTVVVIALALIWATGALLHVVRYFHGWNRVRRLRRESTALEASSQGLLQDVEQTLGLRRHSLLATHSSVDSPTVLGGLRPLVLVPENWGERTEHERRMCLLHEVSHLTRRDDMIRHFASAVRCLFFFHPLVCWLINRLRVEQELLSDDAVIRSGADRLDYARVLLSFTRLHSVQTRPVSALALPFFETTTIKLRIQRLTNPAAVGEFLPLSKRRLALSAMAALGLCLILCSVRLWGVEPEEASPELTTERPASEEFGDFTEALTVAADTGKKQVADKDTVVKSESRPAQPSNPSEQSEQSQPSELTESLDAEIRNANQRGVDFLLAQQNTEQSEQPKTTKAEIRAAADKGVEYLKQQQESDGTWSIRDGELYRTGVTALCTLALLKSGVPVKDKSMQLALEALRKEKPEMTYEIALQTIVFCEVDDERDRKQIQENVTTIEEMQISEGSDAGLWTYRLTSRSRRSRRGGRGDCSNASFALWALDVAAAHGATVKKETWQRSLNYWKNAQHRDGSWGYTGQAPGTGSMTCSGIVSFLAAQHHLNVTAKNDAEKSKAPPEVSRAWKWLEDAYSVRMNPRGGLWLMYYLMKLHHAGEKTGFAQVGEHDWYRDGSRFLLSRQNQQNGSWSDAQSGSRTSEISTAFALLFLNPPTRVDR